MATIARDDDFAVAGRESMVEPSMSRRAPGVHGRAAHATTSANTHGLGLISTNRGGTKRYYHYDALGTAWALTSGSGTVTDTYSYTAFGVLLSSTGSSVNPYRFVGQWGYDDDGARGSGYGLMLLGVRYYSAGFGRFWSWDPIPNPNLYFYAGNAPQQAADPSGAGPCEDVLAACRAASERRHNLCLRNVADAFAICVLGCKPLPNPVCIATCNAQLASGVRGCHDKFVRRESLCEAAYRLCLDGEAAGRALVCITVVAVGTYVIYRLCKGVIAVAGAPETGGGSLVFGIAP